jgi:hypothetical protein
MIMVEKTPTPKATKTAEAAPKAAPKTENKPRVRKEYKPLDLTGIKATPVTTREQLVKHRNTKGERTPEQIAVDKLVVNAYNRWVEAGKPEAWLECNTGYLMEMPLDQVETFVHLVRKAGVYHDHAIRFGRTLEGEDGLAQVLFVAKDRPVKDGESDDAESGDAAA